MSNAANWKSRQHGPPVYLSPDDPEVDDLIAEREGGKAVKAVATGLCRRCGKRDPGIHTCTPPACGHSGQMIFTSDEGTAFCAACEFEGKITELEIANARLTAALETMEKEYARRLENARDDMNKRVREVEGERDRLRAFAESVPGLVRAGESTYRCQSCGGRVSDKKGNVAHSSTCLWLLAQAALGKEQEP